MSYATAINDVVGPRGRRVGVVTIRLTDGEYGPMTEVGAYYIGPYESVFWVAVLFWGPAQEPRPLSMKWGWSGEVQGVTRLVSEPGLEQMATEHLLQRQAEVWA